MEVLTPHSLGEALALKAEHPDALPIQGGTDVMNDLNFDRSGKQDIEAGLDDRTFARVYARNFVTVDVDADHMMTIGGERSGRDAADVSETENRDFHFSPCGGTQTPPPVGTRFDRSSRCLGQRCASRCFFLIVRRRRHR